ncbi:hypothetical protein [Adlercreutzia caecimuris]|uniref:hypothetical protein n=1 Tax=Adlercreutzia caecimuris TaxID=671266 RepID=UPI00272A4DAB|nr:hypothetical protein [Adlercreutzia caecimuris]
MKKVKRVWKVKRVKKTKGNRVGRVKKVGGKDTVPVSMADLERGYLTHFCADGGTGCGMEATAFIAKARAVECAEVLDFLAKGL